MTKDAKYWRFADDTCPRCGANLTKKSPQHVSLATSDTPESERERPVSKCPSCGIYNVVVPKAAKLPEPVVEPPAPEPEPVVEPPEPPSED